MNEAETRVKLIDLKLKTNGWSVLDGWEILWNAMFVKSQTTEYK